jgi:hypothetical protein
MTLKDENSIRWHFHPIWAIFMALLPKMPGNGTFDVVISIIS